MSRAPRTKEKKMAIINYVKNTTTINYTAFILDILCLNGHNTDASKAISTMSTNFSDNSRDSSTHRNTNISTVANHYKA